MKIAGLVVFASVTIPVAADASTFAGRVRETGRIETTVTARSKFGSIAIASPAAPTFTITEQTSTQSTADGTAAFLVSGNASASVRTVSLDYDLQAAVFDTHPRQTGKYNGFSTINLNWQSTDPLFVITNTRDRDEPIYFGAPTDWTELARTGLKIQFPSLNLSTLFSNTLLTLSYSNRAGTTSKAYSSRLVQWNSPSYSNDYTPAWLRPGETLTVRASGSISTFLHTSAVPEPATWGMMIAGFGLIGATLRRQARRSVPA